MRFRHLKVWREANFSCPRAVNKKAVTYHKWYGSSESGPRGSPFSIPSNLYKDLDKHVLKNFSRFRLRAHHLRLHSEWSLANGMVVLAFVINVSVEKFKIRSMCFSSACHSKWLSLQSKLKNGFKPGSSLSRAKAGNCTTDCNSPDTLSLSLSLSLSLLFLKSELLDTLTYTTLCSLLS